MQEKLLEKIKSISPEKRKLLQLMIQEKELTQAIILPQSREQNQFPLSFAQERLWFLDQLEPGSPRYNIPLAMEVNGRFHRPALQQAINTLIQRHESLRTTFDMHNGKPVQIITPDMPLSIKMIDAHAQDDATIQDHILAEARQPFNLQTGPLMRVTLLTQCDDKHIILVTLHHIIADGWSMGVLVSEIGSHYASALNSHAASLPALPIQYADFAVWQRKWLRGDALEKQLVYWEKQLADLPPLLQLPTDRPRTAVSTNRGHSIQFTLPNMLKHKLQALCQREGETLFMVLLAAFQTLLHRYSGETDISVGSPIAGRNRSQLESLIGFFVNTLVLRTHFTDEATFIDILAAVRNTTIDAYANQDVPFELLVERLHPDRNLSHSPLFQVMFAWQNAPVSEIELPQISLRPLDTDKGVATYDITLIMAETPDGLVGTFEYNQDLFDAATMERMAGHLGVVLTGVADDPHQPIAILPLLTEFERSQLLLDWNDTSHPYPLDQPIHRLIEAQVERTPEQIAVYHEGQGWTYAEFNQRANQLAHHLQTCGVGKNDIVGIYMNRCNELILAMFAIHKAGAAYLPLDPTYPAERINFMIEDAQPKVVITEEAVSSQLLAISQGNKQQKTENGKQKTTPHSQLTINNSQLIINNSQLIILSSDWSQFANLPTTNLPIVRLSAHDEASHSPNSLAYVIYTSGSTGKPKGVLLHHRGLCNLAQAYVDQLDLGPGQRLLQFFSQGFDGSVGDIFSSLISGSTLYLPRRETLLNLIELHRYLQKHAITHILMTPSMLRVLPTDNLPALKYVLAGGEQFTREIVSRWLPERRAVNAYGPTESTVVSIFHSCDTIDELPETAVSMPIGRPAPNTQVYILDQNQQPVPIGTPGELYIGGVGVAHGYLNRPELTAERFVTLAEPLSDNSQRTTDNGQRTTVYRTGDLCRWLPNGTIDFLGRIDHQVKIRGFRVELGEIEAVLEQHDGVQTAVLIIHEQDNNQQLVNKQLVNKQLVNKQLVAYVEPQQAPAPTPQALHHFLSEKLPAYMIPSIFITLDSIPKLPNGKLNRRVLPEPSGDYGETAGSYAPPRTPTEEIIAAIWAEVLNVSQVGIQDNFFELGGHSLMATQLLSRIREAFQIELPLQTLFTNPTIAALAPHIDTALQKDSTVSAPPITPVSREQTLPLSFAQQRLWYLHQLNPNSPEYNVPDAVRLNGRLHIPALETSLNHIIQRHELLRTTFVTVDGQPHLQIANTLPLTLPVIDLQHLPPDAREAESMQFVAAEAKRPFDLTTGPLLRVTLLKFDATDHLVLLTMHHIISDGWSMGVFIRELGEGYTAVLHKQPIHLPTLPIQYADFAHWQRTWLQDDVLNNQLAYWQKQLSDAPPLLELPTDRPRPAIQTGNGSYAEFTLSTELTATLKSLSQKEGTTLFMTLLAAFQTLLYRYTNQPDISIGTPIANRNRAEIEGLIGFFINTLVLRTDLHDTPTFLDLLQRVRTVALEAYAHQDVPFDKIVDAIQPERNTSHTPLFQVMFILQNAPYQVIELPDLSLQQLPTDHGIANFDLTLVFEETETHLAGGIEYNTDLFDTATIERLIGHLQTLLTHITNAPNTPIDALPLLTPPEQQQLLVEWNDTQTPLTDQTVVHHRITQQAARTPNAIALIDGSQQLTYQQLNQRANQLAHHLIEQGVRPDDLVGISLNRSANMIITLLAILKTGAAYLPLDPTYPTERLAFMIKDAQPKAIISEEAISSQLSAINKKQKTENEKQKTTPHSQLTINNSQLIILPSDWQEFSHYPTNNLLITQSPSSLAYVIYTSGSTGKPKGVQVTHSGVLNHNLAVIDLFDLQPSDRVWQFATINFDTAVEEIFPTLLSGAVLVLRDEVVPPVSELCHLIHTQQLTVLDLPTAYWHEWVNELNQTGAVLPDSLRLVVVGGEKASAVHLRLWQNLVDETAVTWLNTYGPTEATIIATAYQPTGPLNGEIPIGRPIYNTQTYVLDSHQQPVPIGIPGELYIGGAGVAAGYLNRPALTAERFVSLADYGLPTTDYRLPTTFYRTGDLVRWLPDGNLEYLGRVDDQVKIRGFRIELGEIETVLSNHENVRETAVLARTDTPDNIRLVAYIVPTTTPAPTVTELRDFLAKTLPAYMIPAAFVTLEQMPLMPNSKINRTALPAPDHSRPELAATFIAPQTEKEQQLADIWQSVLGLEEVGIHDDFFELGGDSILSIQVIARANEKGLHLTPRQFFEGSTIGQLAAAATDAPRIQAEQGVVTGPLPLTPIQHWFFEQDFPQQHHWNQAMLFALAQPLQPELLETAVSHLIQHHDALRLRFNNTGGVWQQYNAGLSEIIPVTRIDLSNLDADAQKTAVSHHAAIQQTTLDLKTGPLLRIVTFDCGDTQPDRLLIAVHHLAIDGVSWRILLEDLQTAYAQLQNQMAVSLPPKTTSYQQWAERLVRYAASPEAIADLSVWQQMAKAAIRPLPRDFTTTHMPSEATSQEIVVSLNATETEALLRDVPATYRTEINDVLLTALARTMHTWTHSPTLLVDMEGHGRSQLFEDVDLSRTVGWFTTVYPVALTLSGSNNPGSELKQIKEQLRRIPDHGIGYGILRYLGPETAVKTQLANIPQAEISFNYLGQFQQAPAASDTLTIAPESRGSDRSLDGTRQYLLDVSGGIHQGQLHITWIYSPDMHQPATIKRLANNFINALRDIITHCQEPETSGATPSDFPMAQLDQKKLDKLMAKMARRK